MGWIYRTYACLALLLLLWLPAPSGAATFDATAHAFCNTDLNCTTSSTLSYNITLSASANRGLAVFTFLTCGGSHTAPTVTSVTYNGTTLTQKVFTNPGVDRIGYLHQWPDGSDPTSGTNAILITLSGPLIAGNCTSVGALMSSAGSATGVHRTTALTSFNANSGTGTALSMSIGSSGASDVGIQSACQGSGLTSTTQTSQFTPVTASSVSACGFFGQATAAAGVTAFDWTAGVSDTWIMLGAAFQDVNAVVGSKTLMLMGVGQ